MIAMPSLGLDRLDRDSVEGHPAVVNPPHEPLLHTAGLRAGAAYAVEPRLKLDRLVEESDVADDEAGALEERLPLSRGVVAHMRRIAEAVGLLGAVVQEQVVDDQH